MPLANKQPFKPNPIPDHLNPDDEVLYHELTNEVFTHHDAYFDRFLYCNSLIWTCSRTGKSGLTYKEALDSERAIGGGGDTSGDSGTSGTAPTKKRKRSNNKKQQQQKPQAPATSDAEVDESSTKEPKPPRKRAKTSSTSDHKKPTTESESAKKEPNETTATTNGDGTTTPAPTDQPIKKKKKKYPYDPKKYAMPVPEGFDPSLLTPTGKIDGRKLKSKRNMQLAEELLTASGYQPKTPSPSKVAGAEGTVGNGTSSKKSKAKSEEAKKREEEARKKEEEAKKKAQQAELAKEREIEAKRRKEAAALARQLERQKKEDERKRAVAFVQNWEKKCEDLERDDLRRLPQPTPVNCEIPERLFGDSLYIMEAIYNFHDLYNFSEIYTEGLSFDTLEEVLLDKHEGGALGTLLQFLLQVIFKTQPTQDGYGLDDDSRLLAQRNQSNPAKDDSKKNENIDLDEDTNEYDHNSIENGSENDDDENDENNEKYVNMNDRIGSAIKAAQEVKKTFTKPLPEMEITPTNVSEILRLHLLQSGSFPKGRTIYNGWYSSREDPGLWLCMEEPDLMKKLNEVPVHELEIDERIKILHTLINQLLTFIKSRSYMEAASDQLLELRKLYRKEAADFARWDRENCVKRMQPLKKKTDQPSSGQGHDETHGDTNHQENAKNDLYDRDNHNSNHPSVTCDDDDDESNNNTHNNQRLKSCLKSNGTTDEQSESAQAPNSKSKKISFKSGMNGAIENNGEIDGENGHHQQQNGSETNTTEGDEEQTEQSYEELERAYQQNKVDYEDYQRERAIRHEQLNEILLDIRTQLRNNQSVYAIHPVGRDRAYRRYWLFQSLPGLFVEQDDEFVGDCLPQPTPLDSRYKKLFGKENPLMHPNEADLIRPKTCDVACSTDSNDASSTTTTTANHDQKDNKLASNIKSELQENHQRTADDEEQHQPSNNDADIKDENQISDRLNGGDRNHGDGASEHDGEHHQELEEGIVTDEMNYCTGDEATCYIHGPKRPTQKWWFYHSPESIERLIECLNRRGHRESELHDVLSAESSIIKTRVAECPAYKLNKLILEQSGIRRSRRLRTKTGKRRARNYD